MTAKDELQRTLDEEATAGLPLLVIAGKQDLPEALSVDQVSQGLGLCEVEDWGKSGCTTWLMGTHERAGACSVLRRLSSPGYAYLRSHIWSFVQLRRVHPAAWLQGRSWMIVPCSLYNSPREAEHMAWMHVDGPEPARGVSKDDAIQRGLSLIHI